MNMRISPSIGNQPGEKLNRRILIIIMGLFLISTFTINAQTEDVVPKWGPSPTFPLIELEKALETK